MHEHKILVKRKETFIFLSLTVKHFCDQYIQNTEYTVCGPF